MDANGYTIVLVSNPDDDDQSVYLLDNTSGHYRALRYYTDAREAGAVAAAALIVLDMAGIDVAVRRYV